MQKVINMDKSIVDLHNSDQLEILPETTELRLGCCKCSAMHYIKIIHKDKNVILKFVTEEEL